MSHLQKLFQSMPPGDSEPRRSLPAAIAVTTRELTDFPAVDVEVEPGSRLVFCTDPRSPGADRIRLLRMRLRNMAEERKLNTVLVTSPLPQDGKSTLVLNLATALAERGKRQVLVIDGDLHHSSLHRILRLPACPGLADCLQNRSSPANSIRRVQPLGWNLLPAGETSGNATELLQSPMLGSILRSVSDQFEWVLIDSPPVIALTDALSLQQFADGVLLTVRAGATPRQDVQQAVTLLGRAQLLGVVLNGVHGLNHTYNRYRSYHDTSPKPEPPAEMR